MCGDMGFYKRLVFHYSDLLKHVYGYSDMS